MPSALFEEINEFTVLQSTKPDAELNLASPTIKIRVTLNLPTTGRLISGPNQCHFRATNSTQNQS